MSSADQSELLFFDTFSHESNEELNLDLVQFPKSVFVTEIRIIPLGARVQGDFPGGVRLGATNPTQFHIDFFVNDLSKPGASTFESFGSLEYCQNGQIHMECDASPGQTKTPTDGLVLRGWYTTITLAVYGKLTQVVPDAPVGCNQTQNIQRPTVTHEVLQQPSLSVPPSSDWNPEASNPIPTYTGNVASTNPEVYIGNNYPPENYDNQMYRNDYYDNEQPKDPRPYLHVDEDWEKERREASCERDRRSPRPKEDRDRERERRETRSRRRSLDTGRSSESSRHRERSRDLDRLHSRSRSRDRGDYRPPTRSRSRSADRPRARAASGDRDWDRGSYKKDEYRRHRDSSYDRSRGGSYDKRSGSYERRASSYSKRSPSYERKMSYEKRGPSYEKRLSPYDKRSSSYERRAPSYDKKRHSPYGRLRTSSYGSRSPSRDEPRKRPRTPPGESSRKPGSPRDGEAASPSIPARSEEGPVEYDRNGKPIPRVDFYHQSYRHKNSIRSPSQEIEPPPAHAYTEAQHSSLVAVQIVDNAAAQKPPPVVESPKVQEEESVIDAEPFEPILSDEDICDDLESSSYMEVDYDDYGIEDIIVKYYNPLKSEWKKYENVNKIYLLDDAIKENSKNILNVSFDELLGGLPDLVKLLDIVKSVKKREHDLCVDSFAELDSGTKEEWVLLCEQFFVLVTRLCKSSDIILRIFSKRDDSSDLSNDILNVLLAFCKIGLSFECALAQSQPAFKIRHMKSGVRLAEALVAHKHNDHVMSHILASGFQVTMQLLQLYSKEYMALSIRLMILKALSGCLSSRVAVEHFMQEAVYPKFGAGDDADAPRNGYQALVSIMQTNPLARIKFSVSALIKKLNLYELLEKLHDLMRQYNRATAEKENAEDAELSSADCDFIVHSYEEVLRAYRAQCFHISQPKRFLPVTAQFDIHKDCSNDPLLGLFDMHSLLDVSEYLLTCPSTSSNPVLTSPIHNLLAELAHSAPGLRFLYSKMGVSELLFRTLVQPYGQHGADELAYPHDLTNYSDVQILGLELAYRLKTVYYLEAVSDSQAGASAGDENELIDLLQALYCLTFGSVGKVAVPDVVAMDCNAECLMRVLERDARARAGPASASERLRQRSPAKGYAADLLLATVKFSSDVRFLKRYGARLLAVARDHDRYESSVASALQEMLPYLRPIEQPDLLSGEDLGRCVDVLKECADAAPALPGELLTCLRVLSHHCVADYDADASLAGPASANEEYAELKYRYRLLQVYSLDGPAQLLAVLERLCAHFDQPAVHAPLLASARGLLLAHVLLPALRLLDAVLARLVRSLGAGYRDRTAMPVLFRTFGLAISYPAGAIGHRLAKRAANVALCALLAYAQPAVDVAGDGDSLRRGPWSSLCSEVLAYTTSAPYTFMSGLLAFAELLPLPLPMQSRVPPTARELADAANERRMWSAHLHAFAGELSEVVQLMCASAMRQINTTLTRLCAQLADLAPNTATVVTRAALAALTRELRPGEPASACASRVLGFIACLLTHAPVKCAALHAMAGASPRAGDLQGALCAVLGFSHSSSEHAAAQEYAAHALSVLCDMEVTLTPPTAAPDTLLANSLPGREPLTALLDACADCLAAPVRTCAVVSSLLRTCFVVTEHEFGFQLFRRLVARRKEAFAALFGWAAEGAAGAGGEDRIECLGLYLVFIRILRLEEGEGPLGRRSLLSPAEIADMVGHVPGDAQHPVFSLERLLRVRWAALKEAAEEPMAQASRLQEKSYEESIMNAAMLSALLQKLGEGAGESAPPAAAAEAGPALAPQPLAAQWEARLLHVPMDAHDQRLSSGYWLGLPAASPAHPADDEPNDSDLVPCNIAELANAELGAAGGGGAGALASALRRLLGSPRSDQPQEDARDSRPSGDLPVAVARMRVEGVSCDTFRSRPPNTSRPPSLHVDDFTAMEGRGAHAACAPAYGKPQPASRGMRRIAVADRGRFASATPQQPHYRHLRGRSAWELGAQHFGHYTPSQYMMAGMGWGSSRTGRGPRTRSFMR